MSTPLDAPPSAHAPAAPHFAPAPPFAPPPPRRRGGIPWYVQLAFLALAAMAAAGVQVYFAGSLAWGGIFAVAQVGLTLLAAALVLVWFDRGRNYILLAAAIGLLVGAGWFGSRARAHWAVYHADYTALSTMAGPQAAREVARAAPPRWRRQAVHALRATFEDQREYDEFVSRQYGLFPPLDSTGWLSGPYIADAGRYPQVREWLFGFRHYSQAMRRSSREHLLERLALHLRTAGFPAREVPVVIAGARQSLTGARYDQAFDAMDRWAADAIAVDDFLRHADPNVYWSYFSPEWRDGAQLAEASRRLARLERSRQRLVAATTGLQGQAATAGSGAPPAGER